MHPPIDDSVVLVTGASSGIGRELARLFAARAKTLILVARRAERLDALRQELQAIYPQLTVYVEVCDLSDAVAVDAMLTSVLEKVGAIAILVNNAGMGTGQRLYEQADWQRVEQMIRLNVVALAQLTHRLLPSMVQQGQGGILNISSGAAHAFIPGTIAYTGTKHFVNGFTESLRAELVGTGIVVTQVCPGPVDTEIHQSTGSQRAIGGFLEGFRISAQQCAEESLRGFERGDALVFPHRPYRWLMRILNLMPRGIKRAIAQSAAQRLRHSVKTGDV